MSLAATVEDLLDAVKVRLRPELDNVAVHRLVAWRCKMPRLSPNFSPRKLKQALSEFKFEDEDKAEDLASTQVLAELDSFDPKTEVLLVQIDDSTSHIPGAFAAYADWLGNSADLSASADANQCCSQRC